nr:unnamed protein product [Callosobruchus analis]
MANIFEQQVPAKWQRVL